MKPTKPLLASVPCRNDSPWITVGVFVYIAALAVCWYAAIGGCVVTLLLVLAWLCL